VAQIVKKLGIMTAMEEEFRLIAQSFGFATPREIGPRTFLTARYQDVELTLVAARIGKVAAAVTTSILIQDYKVDAILFTGVAGAAAPDVKIGDLVIADELVQHDMDLKGVMGYQRFDIPLLNAREMKCDPHLVRIARESASVAIRSPEYLRGVGAFTSGVPSVHFDMIASGDTFICDVSERDALYRALPRLKCVEMEGAAVSQVCLEHNIPCVVGRIISDEASHEAAIDFGAFIQQAASVGSAAFVREFVRLLSGQA
jgi:adenosylhomocysteine nucleosidase